MANNEHKATSVKKGNTVTVVANFKNSSKLKVRVEGKTYGSKNN